MAALSLCIGVAHDFIIHSTQLCFVIHPLQIQNDKKNNRKLEQSCKVYATTNYYSKLLEEVERACRVDNTSLNMKYVINIHGYSYIFLSFWAFVSICCLKQFINMSDVK